MQLATPVAVLAGHGKAVSYVRWLGAGTLVTASTDNCLKLWSLGEAAAAPATPAASRTFSGVPLLWSASCYWVSWTADILLLPDARLQVQVSLPQPRQHSCSGMTIVPWRSSALWY